MLQFVPDSKIHPSKWQPETVYRRWDVLRNKWQRDTVENAELNLLAARMEADRSKDAARSFFNLKAAERGEKITGKIQVNTAELAAKFPMYFHYLKIYTEALTEYDAALQGQAEYLERWSTSKPCANTVELEIVT